MIKMYPAPRETDTEVWERAIKAMLEEPSLKDESTRKYRANYLIGYLASAYGVTYLIKEVEL